MASSVNASLLFNCNGEDHKSVIPQSVENGVLETDSAESCHYEVSPRSAGQTHPLLPTQPVSELTASPSALSPALDLVPSGGQSFHHRLVIGP